MGRRRGQPILYKVEDDTIFNLNDIIRYADPTYEEMLDVIERTIKKGYKEAIKYSAKNIVVVEGKDKKDWYDNLEVHFIMKESRSLVNRTRS